jgi:hypothetical protein
MGCNNDNTIYRSKTVIMILICMIILQALQKWLGLDIGMWTTN